MFSESKEKDETPHGNDSGEEEEVEDEEEGDEDEEGSEEEEGEETTTGEKFPFKVSLKTVRLPKLLDLDPYFHDCPLLIAFHYLSSIVLHYQFYAIIKPQSVRDEAIKIVSEENYKCEFIHQNLKA